MHRRLTSVALGITVGLATLLPVGPMPASAADEVRLCVTIRSDEPIEGDVIAAVVSGAATVTVEGPDACASPLPTPAATEISAASASLTTLAALAVQAEHPDGYDRDLFRHWIDADGDGCNTRQEVLIEESLTEVQVTSGCKLSGGSWVSVYDGHETSDPSTLDIDHVIPLAEAWRSGARDWSSEERTAYANDLSDERTLRAVSASSNRSKGDRDPAAWMPPADAFRCQYVEDWVAIKAEWDLSIDPLEHDVLAATLADCAASS